MRKDPTHCTNTTSSLLSSAISTDSCHNRFPLSGAILTDTYKLVRASEILGEDPFGPSKPAYEEAFLIHIAHIVACDLIPLELLVH
jgi:hypothetical protein